MIFPLWQWITVTQEIGIPGEHQVFMVREADQKVLPLLNLEIMLRLGMHLITILSLNVVISRQEKAKDKGAAIGCILVVIM
jgi:hypothetical protein